MIKLILPTLLILLTACGGRYGRGLPTTESEANAYFQAQGSQIPPVSQMKPLMALVGSFDWKMRYTPYPGGKPINFGGTCEFHSEFGGSWVVGNWYPINSASESTFFSLLGYSTARKRYLFGSIDSHGIGPRGEGVEVDSSGATFAVDYEMTMTNVLDPARPILFKRRIEIIDANTIEGIDYRSGWNGSLVPFSTMRVTRKDT